MPVASPLTSDIRNMECICVILIFQFNMDCLDLDAHAHDKIIRLLGDRYNVEDNSVTLEVDSARVKQQNYEYAHYLLTALYFESCLGKLQDLNKLSELLPNSTPAK